MDDGGAEGAAIGLEHLALDQVDLEMAEAFVARLDGDCVTRALAIATESRTGRFGRR
jgi:hypothetical protein